MSATVIELGDVSDHPSDGPDDDLRGGGFRTGTMRRPALAVIVLLCAVVLGASALPAPPLVRDLWSVPITDGDAMTMHGDLVYVHRQSSARQAMTAYQVTTGVVRWTREFSGRISGMDPIGSSGVLLFAGEEETAEIKLPDGTLSMVSYGGTVTAVEPATGEVLWRRPGGYDYTSIGDTALLPERGADGTVIALRLVRAREGTLLWERSLSGVHQFVVQFEGDRPTRVITASQSGKITVLGYADGVPRLTRTLPMTPPVPETGEGSSIAAASGLFLITRSRQTGPGSVAAYRADTLELLWQRESSGHPWAQDCGPVLCVTGDWAVEAVDPRTGESRWTHDGFPSVGIVEGNEYVLLSSNGDRMRQVLVETATGRDKGASARGWVAYRDVENNSVVLVDSPAANFSGSAVSRLELSTGRATLLGTMPILGDGRCTGTGRYLGCQRAGQLVITAVG